MGNGLTKQALGIMVTWISTASSGGVYFQSFAVQVALAFYCTSVFLETTLTSMICYRLLSHGRLIKERLTSEYASLYFAIALLVVESVLPYTLAGIAFVISLGLGSQMMGVFGYLYTLTMVRSGFISFEVSTFNLT